MCVSVCMCVCVCVCMCVCDEDFTGGKTAFFGVSSCI